MGAHENKQAAQDAYEAFGKGDAEGAMRNIDDSVEWTVQVQLLHRAGCVVVAVADEGPGFTWRPNPSAGSESGGWGLFLVDQIADRWGVERTTSGSRVWFEIGALGVVHAEPPGSASR